MEGDRRLSIVNDLEQSINIINFYTIEVYDKVHESERVPFPSKENKENTSVSSSGTEIRLRYTVHGTPTSDEKGRDIIICH